jgi:S1-C subfamily serine protease
MKHASRFVRGLALLVALVGTAAFASSKQEEPAADLDTGVLVVRVEPRSPAALAGIVRGDIILAVDGVDAATVADIQKAVTSKRPGDKVKVTVQHGEAKRTLTAELGELNGRAYLGVYFESGSSTAAVPQAVPDAGSDATPPARSGRPDAQTMPRLQMPVATGAWIVSVAAASPAAKAGIAVGDLVTAVDGTAVDAKNDLATLLNTRKPGDTVVLAVTGADRSTRDVKVTLGENAQDATKPMLGVQYRAVSRLADNLPSDRMQTAAGVRVVAVTDGGPAAKAGIARGDLLTSIDGTDVRTAQQVIDAVGKHKPGDEVKIGVVRAADGAASEAAVTLAENPQDATKAFLGVQLGSFGVIPGHGGQGPGGRTPRGTVPGVRGGLGGTDA